MREVPPEAMTVTSTVPSPPGAIAVMDVGELTVKCEALADPKFTAVTSIKFVPVIVTEDPPCSGPTFGLTLVTVGKENLFAD